MLTFEPSSASAELPRVPVPVQSGRYPVVPVPVVGDPSGSVQLRLPVQPLVGVWIVIVLPAPSSRIIARAANARVCEFAVRGTKSATTNATVDLRKNLVMIVRY
jgi:hypothetical protein